MVAELTASFYNRHIPRHAKGRLIDLGCGDVPLYGAYKNYVQEVTCVDWHEPPDKVSHLDYTCDLNRKLIFQDNSFDTVLLSDVLEHIRHPESLLKEISRILVPGGKVLMNVPFLYWLHEPPFDYFRYTEYALRDFAEDCNFSVIELTALGGAVDVLADLSSKLIIRIPFLGKPAVWFIQKTAWLFGKTKVGTRVTRMPNTRFPLAYGMILEKKQRH